MSGRRFLHLFLPWWLFGLRFIRIESSQVIEVVRRLSCMAVPSLVVSTRISMRIVQGSTAGTRCSTAPGAPLGSVRRDRRQIIIKTAPAISRMRLFALACCALLCASSLFFLAGLFLGFLHYWRAARRQTPEPVCHGYRGRRVRLAYAD